ncbi:MAG: glutamine--tRNA ligase, partial [Clostridia bacterium]|nr:glutamine--tRNA ligase [Clostridia bacterium]
LLTDVKDGVTDFNERFNEQSLKEVDCKTEKSLFSAKAEDKFQFMRVGYYVMDKDSNGDNLVFNEIVSLKDGFKPSK